MCSGNIGSKAIQQPSKTSDLPGTFSVCVWPSGQGREEAKKDERKRRIKVRGEDGAEVIHLCSTQKWRPQSPYPPLGLPPSSGPVSGVSECVFVFAVLCLLSLKDK